jgi:hypothetical protein
MMNSRAGKGLGKEYRIRTDKNRLSRLICMRRPAAPPALFASQGAEQTPSLLAAASLALGLVGWWGAPRRRELGLRRGPVLK